MIVLKTGEMQAMDRQTIADGYPELLLMEAAGRGVAVLTRKKLIKRSHRDQEEKRLGIRSIELQNKTHYKKVVNKSNNNLSLNTEIKKILIFVGKGNNGGDGLVAARFLDMWHYNIRVILMGKKEELTGITATNYKLCVQRGINVIQLEDLNHSQIKDYISKSSLIIDAMLGTGLKGDVREPYAGIIKLINESRKLVIAVDIPSGVDGDDGSIHGQAITADYTATMAFLKTGLCIYPGTGYCGEINVIDIGMPEETSIDKIDYNHYMLNKKEAGLLLPERVEDGHKGTFGKIGVIGGSTGMTGAPYLTGVSALRTGAGLVKLAIPETIQSVVAGYTSELISKGLPVSGPNISVTAYSDIKEVADNSDVLAVGPGLGRSEEISILIKKIITEINIPLVLDADGINAISDYDDLNILKQRQAPLILTPHPGEMSRLLHKDIGDIESDRIGITRKFVKKFKVHLILKGASSLIGLPDGSVYINPTGNEGLATAGSGDVLTGIIAGLLGQGASTNEAAALGPYLHGLAGDLAAGDIGSYSVKAGDIYQYISSAIKKIKR